MSKEGGKEKTKKQDSPFKKVFTIPRGEEWDRKTFTASKIRRDKLTTDTKRRGQTGENVEESPPPLGAGRSDWG